MKGKLDNIYEEYVLIEKRKDMNSSLVTDDEESAFDQGPDAAEILKRDMKAFENNQN